MRVFFVTRRLAFGSLITAKTHVKQLRALGITHVINLRCSNNRKVRKFAHLWLPFKDDKKPRPQWFYERTMKFYRKAMKRDDTKLFVMCRHGICRSASLTYFLLRTSGKTRAKAEVTIKVARPTAYVARGYRKSCEKYLRSMEVAKP